MMDPRTPLTAEDLHALAEIVEKCGKLLDDEIHAGAVTLAGIVLDRDGDNIGRIVMDHTGSYWGWVAE